MNDDEDVEDRIEVKISRNHVNFYNNMGAGGALFFTCIDLEDALGIETYSRNKCSFENCKNEIEIENIKD